MSDDLVPLTAHGLSVLAVHLRERAERAEAEIEQMQRTLSDHLESESAETMRADRAEAERDALTTIVRNLCLGHGDECVCPGCRTVFRKDAALREDGK